MCVFLQLKLLLIGYGFVSLIDFLKEILRNARQNCQAEKTTIVFALLYF